MKFYRVGEFKENVLDGTVGINPKEQAPQFVLNRLNYLLGFLRERSPDNIDTFTKNLEKRYKKLTKTDYIKENSVDISDLVAVALSIGREDCSEANDWCDGRDVIRS